MSVVFDIEADALLDEVTRVWCICIFCVQSQKMFTYGPDALDGALKHLSESEMLIGHNILGYDIPVLAKVLQWKPAKTQQVRDTFVISRLAHSDLKDTDMANFRKMRLNKKNIGSHSLGAWGERLGTRKIEFEDFSQFTPDMLKYCEQDVRVNVDLWQCSVLQKPSFKEFAEQFEEDVLLEQRVHYEYSKMGYRGIKFNVDRARDVIADIEERKREVRERINAIVPPVVEEMKTAEYWEMEWPSGETSRFPTKSEAEYERKRLKHKPAECFLRRGPNKTKTHEFNPGSSKQIREYLVGRYGWVSPQLTKRGVELLENGLEYEALARQYGSTKEEHLRLLDYEEAQLFADSAVLNKIGGMVAGDGKGSAWLDRVDSSGRMQFSLHHIGCVTQRSSMTSPNLQQTPSVVIDRDTKEPVWGFEGRYGCDCRAMFEPSEGYVLVGMDLSGIEGCMLAHFLSPYDSGAYIQQVLTGDVHQQNVDSIKRFADYKIGRGDTKPCYYGLLYGIGLEKQGRQVVACCDDARNDFEALRAQYERDPSRIRRTKRVGKSTVPMRPDSCAFADVGEKVNTALSSGIDGFRSLVGDVKKASKRGYLKVFNRRIPVRKAHAALNTLLQGSAGIIAKRWFVRICDVIRYRKYNAYPLLVVHDETQTEVVPEHLEGFTQDGLAAIGWAGRYYNMRLPLSGEAKYGRNWQETH